MLLKMGRKSFEKMLENYPPDMDTYGKDTEPDLNKFRCYYFKDSNYTKQHEPPTLEKKIRYCRPSRCPHFRTIEKD